MSGIHNKTVDINEGTLAEWFKASALGADAEMRVGSNPTSTMRLFCYNSKIFRMDVSEDTEKLQMWLYFLLQESLQIKGIHTSFQYEWNEGFFSRVGVLLS